MSSPAPPCYFGTPPALCVADGFIGIGSLFSASTLTRNRKRPPVCTPITNCTSIQLPAAIGPGNVTMPALEFNPPPCVCVGGVSTNVPNTVSMPRLVVMPTVLESSRRTSACCPPGFGVLSVVTSTTRKRNAVICPPVLLVKRRRIVNVPKVQLDGAVPPLQTFAVVSRTRFGGTDEACCGSIKLALICALRWMGLPGLNGYSGLQPQFSGPGAPNCAVALVTVVGSGETSTKSAALSSVSCGRPVASLRTKLNSALLVMPAAGCSPAPSRKSVFATPAKPTASSLCARSNTDASAVLKIANPAPSGMSPV